MLERAVYIGKIVILYRLRFCNMLEDWRFNFSIAVILCEPFQAFLTMLLIGLVCAICVIDE
ncbi:hypothetical protein CMETHOX_21610 [Lacrimispora indolis]|nr:hypothetical protein CMETHOX_21610 [[Clostridium] methoxybenzovorans]